MNDFATDLERELLAAARRRAGRRVRIGPPAVPRVLGAVPVLATIALALAVGLGALATVSSRRRVAARPGAGSETATIHRIVADYVMFRRPQTTADRSLDPRDLPAGAIGGLTRLLAVRDGQAVFVALARHGRRITGWLVTVRAVRHPSGYSQASFTPYPIADALPPLELLGRTTIGLVPDSVTRVVWTNFGRSRIVTHPRADVVNGPRLGRYGAAFYTASGRLTEIEVPVARVTLTSSRPDRPAIAAFITRSDGVSSVTFTASHVPGLRASMLAIWLYSGPAHVRFLGRDVARVIVPRHAVSGEATLPRDFRGYRELLVTEQPPGIVTRPGRVLYTGAIPAR